jgi:hypothetical protein
LQTPPALPDSGLVGAIAGKSPSHNRSCTSSRAANDRLRLAETRALYDTRAEEIST